MKAFSRADGVVANNSIIAAKRVEKDAENLTHRLQDYHLNQESFVAVRLALESLKRISEYSEDIAEMAIN